MSQSIHLLYVSGFGRKYDGLRLKLLRLWKFRDVTVEFLPMEWEGNETFEQKLVRIDQAIDRVKNKKIVILGESAGGSMAVHTYVRRTDELYKVMTLCGKNSHPETVSESYYRRSPAFRVSMEKLNDSIAQLTAAQKQAFISIHPLHDSVVPIAETLLQGCKQVRLWSVGHFLSILLGLTLFSPLIVRIAKKEVSHR